MANNNALYDKFKKYSQQNKARSTNKIDNSLVDDFRKYVKENPSSGRENERFIQQQQRVYDRLQKTREQAVQASRNRLNNLRNDAGFKAQVDEASRAYDKLYGQDKYTSAGDYQYYRTKYGHALENVDRYIRDINYLTSVGEMDRDERLDYLKDIPNYSTTKHGTKLLDSAKAFNDYYSQYKSEKDYKDQIAKEAEVNRIRGLDATRTKEAYDVTTKQINAMKERASQYDLQDPRYETTWQRIRKMEEENIRRRDDLNSWSKYQLAEEQQRKAEEEQERIKNLDLSYLETMRKRKYEQMATYDKSIVQWGVTGDQDKIDELIAVSNSVQKEIDELDRDIALKKRYNKGLQYKALTDSIGQEDNYNEEYARQNAVYNTVNSSRSIDVGFGSNIKNLQEASYPMTDAERKTYNRIVAESGFDAGKEYLDYLEPTFEARRAQSISEGLEEYSSKDPVGGIVANIFAGYLKPGGAIYTLGHNLENAFKNAHNYRAALNGDTGSMVDRTELDINSPWFTGSIMGEATTAGITKNMSPTAAFLTQTGLSIAQNLSQMGFGEPLTLALMGMGSMSDTAREIKQNGGTDDKALLGGVLAGIAEVLFEKVSLDQVISMAETGRMSDLLQNLGKQGFIEGSEETFTEVANIISDIMVNGGASDAAQLKEMYLRQGYTDEEAQKMVFKDLAKQIGLAGLGGALSGSVMGAGATGYGAVRNDIRNFWNTRRIGKAIIDNDGTYQNVPTVQELMQRASEISPDVANAFTEKDLQNKQKVGQLFRDVIRAEAADPTFTSESFTNKYAKKSDKNVSRGRTGSLAERFSMTKDFSAKVNGSNTSVYFDHISDDDIVYVRTSDNRVVKADSIETDPKTKQLFENAADYGKEGAKAFINNYDGEMNVTEYAKAFQITAEQAKSYETEDNAVRIGMENGLTETAARSAYYVGKNLQDLYDSGNIASIRNYANTIDTATMKQAIIDKFKGKTVYVDKVDTTNVVEQYKSIFDDQHVKVSQKVDFASVDATKQESLASVVALIRAIGRDVNILSVEDMTENRNGKQSTANAYFKGEDNTYYLCVEQMDQAYMNVAIHETVHDIAKNAPEEYKKLKDIILKYVKDSNTFNADLMYEFNLLYGEDAKWETATQAQKDAAYEELIANTTTAILKDPSTLQSFADRFIKDDETREVFVSFLDKLIDTFRKAFNKIKQRFGWRQIQQIENNLTALEEIRDAYFEGLEGVRDAQPVNTARLTIDNIENQTEAERENLAELSRNGIEIDETGAANVRYSWRTFDSSQKAREDMVNRLVEAGFDRAYSEQWLEDINSVYALVMNDLKALDYKADSRYSWLKKNSDYTQGSVDFNNNCPKRVEFTALCDRLFKEFPNTVLTADDFEALRQVLIKNKITVTCGICFVEDRRQGLSTVVQTYIDQLKDGSLAPMFKNLLKGDTYIPTQYDLITYDGYYDLYKNHRGVYESFRRYNNHRGMASIRLLEGMGEYNNEIRKWTKRTITSKNNKGGLRIFSTSDADPRILLDIMQIVNDAAAKGLQIQGYTKKPWFAKLVRNTGIRLLQSHIPSGIGYETVDGRKVLTFDNREGINTRDPDYLDTSDSLYIGNNVIGINDEQIRIAMTDPMIDQIIPFHSNQSKAILEAKGISHYKNYKTFQTDKKLSDGTVGHQINLYTEVIREFERRGQPIKNKYDFVNAFLQVCKEKNLKPRFSEFLNTDANGDYVYTEGYHKFLVDYKMFDKNGNYIPQVSVTPAFDMEVANATIKKYVKMDEYINKAVAPEVKEKAYQEMKEVVQNKLKFSVNTDSLGNELSEEQQEYFKDSKIRDEEGHLLAVYHGSPVTDITVFDRNRAGEHTGNISDKAIWFTDDQELADEYSNEYSLSNEDGILSDFYKQNTGNKGTVYPVYLNMKNPFDLTNLTESMKDVLARSNTMDFDYAENMDFINSMISKKNYRILRSFISNVYDLAQNGYDGFITYTDRTNTHKEYAVFDSNQVKSVDNKAPTSNPDIRYSANQDYIEDEDGNARWAENRIDNLIKEYGASNSDYSRAYAALIDPRDYLKLTLDGNMLNEWNDNVNDPQHPEIRSLNESELANERQTPFLTIYSNDGNMVQGHEGRHRMRALAEAGIKSVPIAIVDTDTKYAKRNLTELTLSSQDFGNDPVNNNAKVTLYDLVPIKESNRAELIEKFGGDAHIKFSPNQDAMDSEYINNVPAYHDYDVQAALADALDHKDEGNDNLIKIGDIPRYITKLLGINGDFYMYRNHAYENMVSEEQAIKDGRYDKNAHYHNIGFEKMTDAIMQIENPIATIAQFTRDGNPSVIELLGEEGPMGEPLYAVLSFYSDRGINGSYEKKPHIVLTIAERPFVDTVGRNGWVELISNASNDGRLIDINKERWNQLSVNHSNSRTAIITTNSINDNLTSFVEKVKKFKEDNDISYAINPDSIDLSSLNNSDDKNLDNFKNTVGTQYKLNIAKKLTPEVADKMAGRILREYHSSYAREELSQKLTALINDAARQGKDLDVDTFINQGAALLSDVLEKSTEFNQEAYDADDKVRSYLNGIKIKLTSTQEQEVTSAFESVRAYRAGLFGSAVKINQSTGISLDVIWGELSALNPVLFPADASEGDMPMYLADAAQMLKKANYYFNPYGFDAEGMGAIIFADMVADYADDTRIKTVVNQMKAYGRHYFSDTMKDLNRRTRERAAQQKAHTEKLKADLARVKEETRKYLNDMDELILDINNKITQAEYEMRALPAGSDRFDYEQTIAGLKKTRERYEYSVREWKRQQTEEAQRLQKEIEESAKNYLKAGGKGINYAMDARQAVIRTRSLVQQKQLKEQAQRRTVINTVRRNANNLLGRLLNSSDTRHVPENLRIPVATFLQNLDLGFTGEESNAAVTWIENIGKLADKMRNFNEANGTFQVDDMIIEQLNDIASDLRIRLETAGKRLSDMSLYELQQLRDTVSLINAAIYNSDRLLADGRKQRASSLAERSINEMAGKKQRKHTKGILKMAGDFFSIDQLDSFSYAERLGSDFNNVIFKNLRKGFDTKVKYVQQGNEAFAEALKKLAPDEKTAKRLLKTMSGDNAVSTDFVLESGNTLTLTPAQVMELYLLNNREDARRHIYNGGITVMEYGKGKNTVKKQEMVQVTEGDVKNIIDTLTPQQKAFADAMQKFAATSISEWGNNVSMTLWGIKKFTDPNYWKIRSDSNTLNAIATEKNSPDNVGLYHLKNLGSSKATNPLATNPLIVGDAIDSFVSHVDEMSSYGAYTVPLDDAMKWYNYKNGNRTTQRAIENYLGIAGKEYFTDFIKTLNSSQPNAGGMPILDKLISNAKVAAIAANLRVVIQQPSAYARAMDVIDPKYLVQTGNPKAGAEEAQKYCSIAAWKNWGFRDADIGRSLRDVMVGDTGSLAQRINEVTGKPAGWADDVTWGAIWNAVKAEVKDKNPQLRIGTQEFYDAVSERFTEVIDKTQVVDSPFHRSKGMRSKNMLWKMATAFMSEPTKSYNMFYRTFSDAYQNGVNARTVKRIGRATIAFTTATVLNTMLASIIDAIRHRDDDDDKDFWDRYLSEAGQNLLDGLNPLNLIPIGKDIMSMIDGYSPSRLDLDAMNSLIQTGKKALQLINGEGKNLNGWRIAYDLIGDASKVTGIPAGNMLRTVDSIAKMFGANWFGKYNEWASSKQTAGSMYTEYKKTGKWTEDLLEKYVSMKTDEVIKEEEQRELEGHNRKYATTEDVTRYATNQVYGNFASMLAEDDERIAEAYEAKVSGNSATVTRLKKVFTDAGIPGEIFDKAVLVYGNNLEESDPKSIKDFGAKLYDTDDLAEAIVNGYDTDDIYNEIISDSTAQDPEKSTVNSTMKKLEGYYQQYMLDGNTRKAEQIIDNAQKTFELDDSRFESWSKSVDYLQFSEQNPNVSMSQDDYQRYQKVASSGITPETWMQYYEQASTMKADVDSNGEAISGSRKKKVLVLIDSLPITDAQKDALYYYNNWAESTIKEAPWH